MEQNIPLLVVDDEADIRELVRVLVEMDNDGVWVACEASSGSEALQRLEGCAPRVAVIDQMMPGMTGIETAAHIRERRPDVRLILFTAFLTEGVIREAQQVGVDLCLSKSESARLLDAARALAEAAA